MPERRLGSQSSKHVCLVKGRQLRFTPNHLYCEGLYPFAFILVYSSVFSCGEHRISLPIHGPRKWNNGRLKQNDNWL